MAGPENVDRAEESGWSYHVEQKKKLQRSKSMRAELFFSSAKDDKLSVKHEQTITGFVIDLLKMNICFVTLTSNLTFTTGLR